MSRLSFKVFPANAQHKGMRDEQQDSFAFSDVLNDEELEKKGALAILADGMGGMLYGADASNIAVHTFLSVYIENKIHNDVQSALLNAIFFSNSAVNNLALSKNAEGKIGTTLTASVVYNSKLYWVSVGDSRIYVFRDNYLIQQTQDHIYGNLLAEQVASGIISSEEAQKSEEKYALFSFLGMPEIERIDYNKAPVKLLNGDKILLCSDGLYNVLSYDEMVACMKSDPQVAAETLVKKVLLKKRPGQDNVTVLVMEFVTD